MASVSPLMAQVTNLGIVPAGGQSVLYWPTSTTNFVLQTTANLATPNWVTATNAVTVNAVTVTNSAPSGFFRLLAATNTTAGMVLIPAGWFMMGNFLINSNGIATNDTDITDANPTNVYVSAFYMDANLVSYSQWEAVHSYATNNGYSFVHAGAGKAANHPVQTVDWFDCLKWSNARSQQAGLTPAYYTDAGFTHVFTNGETTVYLNLTNNGYRLPTEAEWEKAARGGLRGQRFPWGNLGNSISESLGNYDGNTGYSYDLGPNGYNAIGSVGGTSPATSPVGSFAPNGYGLYDMAGNVLEWCWDWYQVPSFTTGSPYLGGIDPTGPATGSYRVLRGGWWGSAANGLRCDFRGDVGTPPVGNNYVGFRCVRGY